jgi:circadian clock protein KaiB
VLRLHVTGIAPQSIRAKLNIRQYCEEQPQGRDELDAANIHQPPALAHGALIIAASSRISKLPQPLWRLVRDPSNTERLLLDLDLPPKQN